MTDFILHHQLAEDSFWLTNLELSEVRLFNNANFPWLLLIPRRNDIREIFELTETEQLNLFAEITALAEKLKIVTQCDKINIGALGNMVPQLHIHIIARFNHDTAWPKPAWGAPSLQYTDQKHAVKYWQEKLSL